ncbi:MAG: ABC transporter permease [Chthoniobacterales bacterium]
MIQDLKYAVRILVKSPGFTIVAFFAIAVGIGVNTTIFGIINALLLKPLPVAHPEQLVQMYTLDARNGKQSNSYPNYRDYAEQNTVLSGLAAYQFAPMAMTAGGETINLFGQLVTGNYFSVLQVPAALGRTFAPDEDTTSNGHPVVVLGHRFWKKLGGDRNVVGTVVTLNGRPFSVIGVAPASFTGTDVGVAPDIWVPLAMRGWISPGNDWYENRRALFVNAIGRLKQNVTIEQAEAQMKTIARQLEQAYPDFNKERSVALENLERAKTQGLGGPNNEGGVQSVSLLFLGAAASILLIACANVANLMLARATTRHREMAVRLALGASRRRIIQQLLTESVLLALLGGIGGVVLAYWFGDVLLSLLPPVPVPLNLNPQPDARVLLFALTLALISGVVFGLAPALQTSRWDLTHGLRERASTGGSRSKWNLRNLLVIAQISGSLLLLIASGLFLKAFHKAQSIDPGYRTDKLALISVDMSLAGYDAARGKQTVRTLLEQVRRDPQVISADLGQTIPLGFNSFGRTIFVEGRADAQTNGRFAIASAVTPGFFGTMAIPVLRGRAFSETDCERETPQVAMINETMARQYWPGEDAVGKRFHFFGDPPLEIIGVIRDLKMTSLGEASGPVVFVPFTTSPLGGVTFFIHTAGAPAPLLASTHRLIRAFDNHIPIIYEKTITDHLAFALWPSWMGAILLGSFGLLALVLASMGVYGVMAYSVNQRTRELGIRLALGAQKSQVVNLVLRQGMVLAVIGLVLGLALAFASMRAVGALLYGVNPSDPVVFAVVTSLLTTAAFAACYFPARRAVKIDPVVALRFE